VTDVLSVEVKDRKDAQYKHIYTCKKTLVFDKRATPPKSLALKSVILVPILYKDSF